jgi:hypothetical protein
MKIIIEVKQMEKDREKSYTIRKVEDNLIGTPNHITIGSDVGSEPFPFTEEDYLSREQIHYHGIDSIEHV